MRDWYGKGLEVCLNHKWIVLLVTIALLGGSAYMSLSKGLNFMDMDMNLADFGISGDKLVFKCWEAKFVGRTSKVHERLVNPHNALMYMVKDIPTEPTFLYSDVNLYLGENVFTSNFTDGGLHISIKEGSEQFVTDTTKVFAYYPKAFASAIGKIKQETVIRDTDDYVITEYHI